MTIREKAELEGDAVTLSSLLTVLEEAVIAEDHSADSGYNCDVCRALAAGAVDALP